MRLAQGFRDALIYTGRTIDLWQLEVESSAGESSTKNCDCESSFVVETTRGEYLCNVWRAKWRTRNDFRGQNQKKSHPCIINVTLENISNFFNRVLNF